MWLWLQDPDALKDATSHGMRCIAQMKWEDADHGDTPRAMKLGVPCDTMGSKLCFQGSACTYPVMTCMMGSDVFTNLIDDCHGTAYPGATPPGVTFPANLVSCDIGSQFSGANVPYYCIAISVALIILSVLLIKVWYIVTVAKLLLYVYVGVEFVCGFGVLVWSLTLLADDNTPLAFSLGCMAAAGLMLFTAATFQKGLTTTPCMLNISFLAALVMAIVFLIAGMVLLFGSDEVCKKAEDFLIDTCTAIGSAGTNPGDDCDADVTCAWDTSKLTCGADETQISAVEESLQSSFTALTDIMLLVGGVAASSVILSLRMKEALYEEKEKGAQKLVALDAKQLDKKVRSTFYSLVPQFPL